LKSSHFGLLKNTFFLGHSLSAPNLWNFALRNLAKGK
jgi:hypothetical protein